MEETPLWWSGKVLVNGCEGEEGGDVEHKCQLYCRGGADGEEVAAEKHAQVIG